MFKRFSLIAFATLLAGLILFVTLRYQPSEPPVPAGLHPLTPQAAPPPAFNPDAPSSAPRQTPPVEMEDLHYTRRIEPNELIEVFGKRTRPKPQGVIEVDWPGARIFLTPYRMIEIRSSLGSFLAPDYKPRSGEFTGPVVLTLFESAPDRHLDTSPSSPDIRLRLFLQNARFDLVMGTMESTGDVHLTAPRVDFQGTGLKLTYDEGRHRIDHLQIDQGKALRIKTASSPSEPSRNPSSADTKNTSSPNPATAKAPPTFYLATFARQVLVRAKDATVDADALHVIFALASANQNKIVRGVDQPSPLPGGSGTSGGSEASGGSGGGVVIPAPPAPTPATNASASDAASQAVDSPLPPDQSMTPVAPDDLIVTWAGPLTVDPQDSPPPDLHTPQDVLLQLEGRPLRITTARHETVVAATLDYLSTNGRTRVEGSDDYPMIIQSPAMGVLTAPSLVIEQSTGLGKIAGAGSLRATADLPGATAADPIDRLTRATSGGGGGGAGLPPGMSVKWSRELDLSFYLRNAHSHVAPTASPVAQTGALPGIGALPGVGAVLPTPKAAQGALPGAGAGAGGEPGIFNALGGIKTATFVGDVDVQHPQFMLQADQLSLGLNDPALSMGKQSLDQIVAQGNTHVAYHAQGDRAQGTLSSDKLTIDMVRQLGGGTTPTAIHARGNVRARQLDESLATPQLDLELAPAGPRSLTQAFGKSNNKAPRLGVRALHARDGVDILGSNPQVHIIADSLDADEPADPSQAERVQIRGAADSPAQLLRADGSLTGQTILWSSTTRTGQVPGPGTLTFISTPPTRAHAAAHPATAPQSPPTAPTKVAVTWRDSMHFDDANGSADFLGQVDTRARLGHETTDLSSDTLHVDFAPDNASAKSGLKPGQMLANAPADTQSSPADAANPLLHGSRAIRAAQARGRVRFQSESWQNDDPTRKLATRLSLDGPLMTFDNLAQQVQIIGPGHMLFEDYRPATPGTPGSNATPGSNEIAALETPPTSGPPSFKSQIPNPKSEIPFSGRGDTLFTWTGQYTLDTAHNSMVIEQQVQMVHKPAGDKEPINLDCRRFEADMASSGGMGTWLGGSATQPTIKSILADQDVRVVAARHIIQTDHLDYQGATQTITLRADPDTTSQITDPNGANPNTFEVARWNLRDDRLEIDNPGRIVAPPQSQP